MPNYLTNLPLIANGTINPSVFLMMDTSRNNACLQAVGSPLLIGVSQPGSKIIGGLQQAEFPGTTPTTQPAAYAGDNLEIFFDGDVCGLTVGSTAVNPGDLLTNDGNGCGITATSGKYAGAMTFSSGNPGEVIDVLVLPPGIKV